MESLETNQKYSKSFNFLSNRLKNKKYIYSLTNHSKKKANHLKDIKFLEGVIALIVEENKNLK